MYISYKLCTSCEFEIVLKCRLRSVLHKIEERLFPRYYFVLFDEAMQSYKVNFSLMCFIKRTIPLITSDKIKKQTFHFSVREINMHSFLF